MKYVRIDGAIQPATTILPSGWMASAEASAPKPMPRSVTTLLVSSTG